MTEPAYKDQEEADDFQDEYDDVVLVAGQEGTLDYARKQR